MRYLQFRFPIATQHNNHYKHQLLQHPQTLQLHQRRPDIKTQIYLWGALFDIYVIFLFVFFVGTMFLVCFYLFAYVYQTLCVFLSPLNLFDNKGGEVFEYFIFCVFEYFGFSLLCVHFKYTCVLPKRCQRRRQLKQALDYFYYRHLIRIFVASFNVLIILFFLIQNIWCKCIQFLFSLNGVV